MAVDRQARQGLLFDPEPYPWLQTPWIGDAVVLAERSHLGIVNGKVQSDRIEQSTDIAPQNGPCGFGRNNLDRDALLARLLALNAEPYVRSR